MSNVRTEYSQPYKEISWQDFLQRTDKLRESLPSNSTGEASVEIGTLSEPVETMQGTGPGSEINR